MTEVLVANIILATIAIALGVGLLRLIDKMK